MMPVDPPPPPYIPVGGSEGDQPRDRVRGVPRGPLSPATPDAGDVEALAREVCPCTDDPYGTHVPDLDAGCGWALALCRAVLASDWLASHDAATADRVRRETAEGIAAAIAATAIHPTTVRTVARIAREAGR